MKTTGRQNGSRTGAARIAFAACAVLALAACGGAQKSGEQEAADPPKPAEAKKQADPNGCIACHQKETPGIVDHYLGSTHAEMNVDCFDCHEAKADDIDAWQHYDKTIATIVTPKDCSTCHETEAQEFQASHHSKAGNILHSLDNLLAESVEGHRGPIEIPNPHNPSEKIQLNGLAFANSGCHQCHGSQIALVGTDGSSLTPWKLAQPEGGGKAVVTFDASSIDPSKLKRDESGRVLFDTKTWPNTGIGRMNLDGSRGSCTACHSRHDFSSRRARQPENCGKCHLGPDHPQKEIYEESKHGIAYRDMKDKLNLDGDTWILGVDYSGAPTCATCHMSATRNQPITHDPRKRISWNNRPPKSLRIDTDDEGTIVTGDAITHTWQERRDAMKDVCRNCHAPGWINSFYAQYDDFIQLYNHKYAEPGLELMASLHENGLLSKPNFDETIEWTWFYIWHHEGRRGRHGAAMMAPDYSHWHGTYEVADRWYNEFLPEAREIIEAGLKDKTKKAGAQKAKAVLDKILAMPEHKYPTTGQK